MAAKACELPDGLRQQLEFARWLVVPIAVRGAGARRVARPLHRPAFSVPLRLLPVFALPHLDLLARQRHLVGPPGPPLHRALLARPRGQRRVLSPLFMVGLAVLTAGGLPV